MGNAGSSGNGGRRRQGSRRSQPEIRSNNYVFAAASPYPNPAATATATATATTTATPTVGYYHPPPAGYYPPVRMPLPAPYDDHHHHHHQLNLGTPSYPCLTPQPSPAPYVDHQKAVTIRNDVNLKKDTLTLDPDFDHPGYFLLSFTFDATVPGSITVIYFAKEGDNCKLTPTKEDLLPPVRVHFEKGLGQKFRQPSGSGIDFSMFEESELMKRDIEVCPIAVKADACPANVAGTEAGSDGNLVRDNSNSQITQAVFDKDKGGYKVKVLKQILWVNGMRYELQEIYGIGNTVEGDFDSNDPGKECVICLSEPRDTTVLPCRHMCMCSGCAKVLRFQTNRCPICRQPVERLLEIKVNNGSSEEKCG